MTSYSPPSLSEGVARMLELEIAHRYTRRVDDVVVTSEPPSLLFKKGRGGGAAGAGGDNAAVNPRVIPAAALPAETQKPFTFMVQSDVSRAALKLAVKTHTEKHKARVAEYEAHLSNLMAPGEVEQISVQNRPDICITVAKPAEVAASGSGGQHSCESGSGGSAGQQPGEGAAGEENVEDGQEEGAASGSASSRPLIRSKAVVKEGLRMAIASSMLQLGADPSRPFVPGMATQILGHPQFRALLASKLDEGLQVAEEEARDRAQQAEDEQEEEEEGEENHEAGEAGEEAGAGAAASKTRAGASETRAGASKKRGGASKTRGRPMKPRAPPPLLRVSVSSVKIRHRE